MEDEQSFRGQPQGHSQPCSMGLESRDAHTDMCCCVTLQEPAWGRGAAAFASLSSRLHKQGRAALVLWTAPTVLPKRCRSLALQAARVGAEMETAPSSKSTWPSSGQPAFLPAVPTEGWQRQDKSPLPVLSGIGLLSSPWQLQHLPSTSLKSVSLLPRDQLIFPLHPPCIHNCSAFLNNKLQYLITP